MCIPKYGERTLAASEKGNYLRQHLAYSVIHRIKKVTCELEMAAEELVKKKLLPSCKNSGIMGTN